MQSIADETLEQVQDLQKRIEAGDPEVVPLLIDKLKRSHDRLMIRLLIRVIASLATKDHLRALSKLYRHHDTHVRLWVLATIARHENHEFFPLILHGYLFDRSKRIRSACRRVVRRLSPGQLVILVSSMETHKLAWMRETASEARKRLMVDGAMTGSFPLPEAPGESSQELEISALDGADLGPAEEGYEAPPDDLDDQLVVSELNRPAAKDPDSPDPRERRIGIAEAIARQDKVGPDRTFSRRDCPECGERIMVEALLCRYCATIFEPEELDKVMELAKVRVVPLPVRSPSHRGSALVVDLLISVLLLPVAGAGVAYLVLRDSLGNGQSLGKRLYQLRVLDSTTGEPCTVRQSLARNLWLLIPLVPMIEVVLLSAVGLRFGDRMANTRVVFEDDPPATAVLASATLLMASIFALAVVLILGLRHEVAALGNG